MQAATIPAMYPGAAPTTARVLIADDQPQILEALQLLLKRSGFSTEAVTHPACVIEGAGSGFIRCRAVACARRDEWVGLSRHCVRLSRPT